jgi:RNA polymerase sigma-70 factor, ECF subfamily
MKNDSMRPSLPAADSQRNCDTSLDRRQEFDNLVAHSLPRFRRIAMRWLRNSEDAEDAVQDALLSAFRHIAQFDRRAQMSTWLTSIVINAVRMQLRRRVRRPTSSLDETTLNGQVSVPESLVDARPTPEQDLQERQLQQLVTQLARRLPTTQRTAASSAGLERLIDS